MTHRQTNSANRATAYLSLGSNLGDRVLNLVNAVSQLETLGQVEAVSSLYETEPMEVKDQPWFLNCAVELRTALTPNELLRAALDIERRMGRNRVIAKGPRSIDIDILLYADEVIATPELTVPHPAMHERRFVLAPLAEIAPDVIHPVLKKSTLDLKDALRSEAGVVRRFDSDLWHAHQLKTTL